MEKGRMRILQNCFDMLVRGEVERAVLLAELKTSNESHAYRNAFCDLMNVMARERYYRKRAPRLDDICAGDPGFLARPDEIFERWQDVEEWRAIVSGLPPLARKLAQIAKRCAESFEDLPGGVWSIGNLVELRRRVKRDFIAWERTHDERKYYKARSTLVAVLRDSRKRKYYMERPALLAVLHRNRRKREG